MPVQVQSVIHVWFARAARTYATRVRGSAHREDAVCVRRERLATGGIHVKLTLSTRRFHDCIDEVVMSARCTV